MAAVETSQGLLPHVMGDEMKRLLEKICVAARHGLQARGAEHCRSLLARTHAAGWPDDCLPVLHVRLFLVRFLILASEQACSLGTSSAQSLCTFEEEQDALLPQTNAVLWARARAGTLLRTEPWEDAFLWQVDAMAKPGVPGALPPQQPVRVHALGYVCAVMAAGIDASLMQLNCLMVVTMSDDTAASQLACSKESVELLSNNAARVTCRAAAFERAGDHAHQLLRRLRLLHARHEVVSLRGAARGE